VKLPTPWSDFNDLPTLDDPNIENVTDGVGEDANGNITRLNLTNRGTAATPLDVTSRPQWHGLGS